LNRFRLAGLYAHPDHDAYGIGGTIAFERDRIDLSIVLATSGDAGEISDPSLATPVTNITGHLCHVPSPYTASCERLRPGQRTFRKGEDDGHGGGAVLGSGAGHAQTLARSEAGAPRTAAADAGPDPRDPIPADGLNLPLRRAYVLVRIDSPWFCLR
jgi:hypothetical protein